MTNNKDGKVNKSLAKPLATAAGALGLIQGIAWTICSVLCICCYYGSIQVDISDVSLNQTDYYQIIYILFLDGSNALDASQPRDVIITPRDFFIFMWFYLVFCTVWAVTSGTIIWAMIHEQWQLSKSLFGAWSAVTILISIVDIVLAGVLISDYISTSVATSSSYGGTEVLVCYGIVMSLAARGYLLLVVNVIFGAIMIKFTIDIVMGANKETTMPIIHGYESNYVNPPWYNDNVKDFWASSPQQSTPKPASGYDNRGFERSQSFFTPPISNQNTYSPAPDLYTPDSSSTYPSPANLYNSAPSNKYNGTPNNNYSAPQVSSTPSNNPTSFAEAIANRTATIGRNKGRRSPPNNISPPSIPKNNGPPIPAPDYTPPGSPNGLKSVLRSKSNYNRSPY